jgi:hypothetical protein
MKESHNGSESLGSTQFGWGEGRWLPTPRYLDYWRFIVRNHLWEPLKQ